MKKQKLMGIIAILVMFSGLSAQSIYFDESDFDNIPFITDEAEPNTAEMSVEELEMFLKSKIKSEITVNRENSKETETEVKEKVDSEMTKYRKNRDEYIKELTEEMNKKTSEQLDEIKENYTLQLSEEKAKLQKQYEEDLKKQKAQIRDEYESKKIKENKAMSDLERLLAMDEEEEENKKEHPFEFAEFFTTGSNKNDKSTVKLLSSSYNYKGTNYNSITLKGNTGTPKNGEPHYYDAYLKGTYFEDYVIPTLSDANCLKFTFVGDGGDYQIQLKKKGNNFYYYNIRVAVPGLPKEIVLHKTMFKSYPNREEIDFSTVESMTICYSNNNPSPNCDFEATFFDMNFVNDPVYEEKITEMNSAPFTFAELYKGRTDNQSNGKAFVREVKSQFEGKSYRGINFYGNTGYPDGKNNAYYQIYIDDSAFPKELLSAALSRGKTMKFKVLGDGQQYRIVLGAFINGDLQTWEYKFQTRKGKVSEVKINIAKFKSWKNLKLDLSKIEYFELSYEWNYDGQEYKKAPKADKNFNIQIFDCSIF